MQSETQESSVQAQAPGDLYEQFNNFPFESDTSFLEGLKTITSNPAAQLLPPDELEDVIGRAKAFYFSKLTGLSLDWQEYKGYRSAPDPSSTSSMVAGHSSGSGVVQSELPSLQLDSLSNKALSSNGSESPSQHKTLSFAEISELIQTGQTHLIPNNDLIPVGLNEANPSESVTPIRKKPWEVQAEQIDSTSTVGS